MLNKVMRNGTGPHTSRSSSGAPSVLPARDVSFALPVRQSRGLVLQYLVFGRHESGGSLVLNQEKKQHLLVALCRLVLLPNFRRGGGLLAFWLEENDVHLKRILSLLLNAMQQLDFFDDKVRIREGQNTRAVNKFWCDHFDSIIFGLTGSACHFLEDLIFLLRGMSR